jgi:SpoVK/Ycf46/Vps4 family AAA+-type ATPase
MMGEFLREWDGAIADKTRNPFVLLATNRPYDLDPAVLRRAADLICMKVAAPIQRQGILSILLQDEELGDITVEVLARLTHSFTGSDQKIWCVTATRRCVQEQTPDPVTKEFPKNRILLRRHFDVALRTVRATSPNGQMMKQSEAFHRKTG